MSERGDILVVAAMDVPPEIELANDSTAGVSAQINRRNRPIAQGLEVLTPQASPDAKRLVDRTSYRFDFVSPEDRQRSRSAADDLKLRRSVAEQEEEEVVGGDEERRSTDAGPEMGFEIPAAASVEEAGSGPVTPPPPPIVAPEEAAEVWQPRSLLSANVEGRVKNFRKRRLSKDIGDQVERASAADAAAEEPAASGGEAPSPTAAPMAPAPPVAAAEVPPLPPPPPEVSTGESGRSDSARGGGGGGGSGELKPSPLLSARSEVSEGMSPMVKKVPVNVAASSRAVDKGALDHRKSITFSSEMEDEVEVTAFDRTLVGTYSCHGAEPGPSGSVDKINQDCACLSHPFARTLGTSLFCVFDGHGKHGHVVSQVLAPLPSPHRAMLGGVSPPPPPHVVCPHTHHPPTTPTLHPTLITLITLIALHTHPPRRLCRPQEVLHSIYHELEENAERLLAEPAAALADAFEAVNAHLQVLLPPPPSLPSGAHAPPSIHGCSPPPLPLLPQLCVSEEPREVDATESGACAVVAFMRGCELVVAGAGDCRAVLATRHGDVLTAVALSTDHKVSLPGEQARIEKMGGWVRAERGGEEDGDFEPARLYEVEGKPWLGPGLCVARCLGDLNAARVGLIPTPEVCLHTVQPEDQFLILASDGVWEFVDNDEAVRIVEHFHSKGLPAIDACKYLIAKAARALGGYAPPSQWCIPSLRRYLIAKAALCWRRFEGDYRDDITAIVLYLSDVVSALEKERLRGTMRRSARRRPPPPKSWPRLGWPRLGWPRHAPHTLLHSSPQTLPRRHARERQAASLCARVGARRPI